MSTEQRLDRLESLDEIRQLAAKYSVTLDMRDLDMHVNLFVPDVRVGKNGEGRQALKAWADSTFRDKFKKADLFINTSCENMRPMRDWGPIGPKSKFKYSKFVRFQILVGISHDTSFHQSNLVPENAELFFLRQYRDDGIPLP